VGLSSAVVLAAVAAAHRGATALDRLDADTLPATVEIPNFDSRVDLTRVRHLAYVEAVAPVAGGGIGLLHDGAGGSTEQLSPVDDELFRGLERPKVLSGRLFDPHAPDEAVVTQGWAEQFHRGVGDTAVVVLPTARQQKTGTEDVPRGPAVTMRIVGIIRAPAYLDWPGLAGSFIPSPGLATTYRTNWDTAETRPDCPCQWASVSAFVRLRNGADDIPRLRSDLSDLFPGHTFNLINLEDRGKVHQHDVVVQCWGILAFAAAALVAAVVVVAQAVARHVSAAGPELRTASALGYTRLELVTAAAIGPSVAGAGGALAGAAAAILSSRWTPLGIAHAVEPDPGATVDRSVLVPGAATAVAIVVAVAVMSALRSTGTASRAGAARRSPIALWASRAGFPIPVQVGARFALEPGPAGRPVPALQTVAAVVVAVAGVSAALVVNSGVDDALTHPERYGQTFQAASFVGFGDTDFFDPHEIARTLERIGYVDGFVLARQSSAGADGDRVGMSLFSYTPSSKPLATVVLAGRMPAAADEVALAPSSLRSLGASVGDSVTLEGDHGSSAMRVVGRVLMPATDNSRYDQGGWVTDRGYDRLFSGFDAHWVLVSSDPAAGSGRDLDRRLTDDAAATLGAGWARSAAFADMGTQGLTSEPLRQIRWFPAALGALVALLAAAALVHAGAVAVRRRAFELANLRARGRTRIGAALAVVCHGGIVAVTGLLVGLPVGAAVGRTVWRTVAGRLPLQPVAPDLIGLWFVAPAVVAVGLVLSVVPAVRVARLPIARVLRAE
jgi:hypothetical protein